MIAHYEIATQPSYNQGGGGGVMLIYNHRGIIYSVEKQQITQIKSEFLLFYRVAKESYVPFGSHLGSTVSAQ